MNPREIKFWLILGGLSFTMMLGALGSAYLDGRKDAKRESAAAVVLIDSLGKTAQIDLDAKVIKRIDDQISHIDKIKERAADARRDIESISIPVSGDARADRLASLIAWRDRVQRLRDDNERARSDYLEHYGPEDVAERLREAGPAYG